MVGEWIIQKFDLKFKCSWIREEAVEYSTVCALFCIDFVLPMDATKLFESIIVSTISTIFCVDRHAGSIAQTGIATQNFQKVTEFILYCTTHSYVLNKDSLFILFWCGMIFCQETN